jgi:hypothetical protein
MLLILASVLGVKSIVLRSMIAVAAAMYEGRRVTL